MVFLGIKEEVILEALKQFGASALTLLPKVVFALAVLLVGLKVINCAARWLQRRLESMNSYKRKQVLKRSIRNVISGSSDDENNNEEDVDLEREETHRVDPTLMRFAVSFASNGLKALLLISVASIVNISTTSFVAVLSMCSLAIGLALQGLLKDLAAGVMLLVFRRYEVGDLIDIAGVTGRVVEIALFETVVRSLDNKTITVPNSQIKVITNLSEQRTIRVDVVLKIHHDTKLRSAKDVLLQLVRTSPRVLQEPAPEVLVSKIDETGKELTMRVWLRRADYIPVPFALREEAVLGLEEAGLALARWPSPYSPSPFPTSEAAADSLPTLLGRSRSPLEPQGAGGSWKARVA